LSAVPSSKDDVVVWQGWFERVRRLSHIFINWQSSPCLYSIESSPDGIRWKREIDWKEAFENC
jgi:hypothetical protein